MNIGISLFLVISSLSKSCTPVKWELEPQPNDLDNGSYDESSEDDGHICLRECKRGDIARICYYKFNLEEYSVLGSACGDCPKTPSDCLNPGCVAADAYKQNILTVNHRLPGPSIQVCKGDTVLVDVFNNIPDSNVTIHWHGVKHQGVPGTLWMDGVPYVTQCPVLFNQTFQYRFVPGESGTFLWHAFDGAQQLLGLVGSLIVREPDSSENSRHLYDYDLPSHIILVQDWVHHLVEDNTIQAVLRYLMGQTEETDSESQVPDAYLINGRGIELTLHRPQQTPVMEFYVHHGFRYRFRLIGGTSLTCPFRLTIQGHQLLIISADTNTIKPVLVDSLVVSSGERYDVILNATQPVCSYWMLVEGIGECRLASQAALLRYHGCTLDNITLPTALAPGLPNAADRYTLNPLGGECSGTSLSKGICVSQLSSPLPNYLRLSRQPDFKYLVNVDPKAPSNEDLPYSPYSSLSLTSKPPNNSTQILMPLNAVFEMLMVNTRTSNMSLSCHIHGHDFYIAAQGKLPHPSLSQSLNNLQLKSISRFMASKDTIAVPDGGYVLVRVLADNPGFWVLRCRSDPEMSVVIQVGQVFDMPDLPDEFPVCEGFNPNSKDFLTM